ncbi:50S ribosomal protein L1 [Candidatus Woesearchaeota archaeon]|nr:50S ribosomal protein L1 [Candidatus Woesearchaeota archaeon]
MEKKHIIEAVKQAKAAKKKGNFIQTIDLIANLKEIDVSKEDKIEEFVKLPKGRAKPAKVCAFIGPELKDQASEVCDEVILSDNFSKWSNKRKCKKLARNCDFFIAQANIMPQVAKTFGKYLGVLGKMPNPKAGQIVPPKTNLKPLVEKLKNSVRVTVKKAPVVFCGVGNEKMSDDDIAENAIKVLNRLKSKLPRKKHNIGSVLIKTTMGKPIKIGEKSGK